MQDYKVHIKHTDGHYEYVPYFCLPANELNDVIAPSCYSCFDYPNALADLVVRLQYRSCSFDLLMAHNGLTCVAHKGLSSPLQPVRRIWVSTQCAPALLIACSILATCSWVCTHSLSVCSCLLAWQQNDANR